jgi:hypothetical protein
VIEYGSWELGEYSAYYFGMYYHVYYHINNENEIDFDYYYYYVQPSSSTDKYGILFIYNDTLTVYGPAYFTYFNVFKDFEYYYGSFYQTDFSYANYYEVSFFSMFEPSAAYINGMYGLSKELWVAKDAYYYGYMSIFLDDFYGQYQAILEDIALDDHTLGDSIESYYGYGYGFYIGRTYNYIYEYQLLEMTPYYLSNGYVVTFADNYYYQTWYTHWSPETYSTSYGQYFYSTMSYYTDYF